MTILLNGQPHPLTATTLADLLVELGLTGRRVAIELNGEIAPRSQHATLMLKANDRIEVVHAIGGG